MLVSELEKKPDRQIKIKRIKPNMLSGVSSKKGVASEGEKLIRMKN